MVKDLLIITGMAAAAIVIGGILFVYGSSNLPREQSSSVAVITQGQHAPVATRTDYLIRTHAQLEQLWTLLYGTGSTTPPMPDVDFSHEEVVALFAGEKPTTGYEISVASLHTKADTRVLAISLLKPDASCAVAQATTTPYEIAAIPASTLTLTHVDVPTTRPCS